MASEKHIGESNGPVVPALRASVRYFAFNHALTRAATHYRRFAPGLFVKRVEVGLSRADLVPASKRRQLVAPAVRPGRNPRR